MRNKVSILLVSIVILFSGTLSAQKLNKILKNHFEVIGQENLLKVNSVIMKGKVIQQGMEFPLTIMMKRPANVLMEVDLQGQKMITAYNGEMGWMINPMMGSSEPQDMGPDETKSMKTMSDLDGDLYNFKDKGYTVELIGKEEMEGTECFKLKLVREEGDETFIFIDTEAYVIIKTESERNFQGAPKVIAEFPGNYKMVEGIAMPFSITQSIAGQTIVEIVMESVELNAEVADSLFIKPSK